MFKKCVRLLALFLFPLSIFSACTGPTPQPGSAAATPTVPSAPLELAGAQRTAADFLNAWVSDNYDAMYGMLTENSRDAYSRPDFESLYVDNEKVMTLLKDGKSYTLTHAIRQTAYAEIAYDMTFNTQQFGVFTDPGRVMHLAPTSGGWQVAWSPGDIIAEFKNGAVLDVSQAFPNRGNIYDRDGSVIADQKGAAIVVTLRTLTYPDNNPAACFAELSRLFPIHTAAQMQTLYGPATRRDFAYELGEMSLERFTEERAALERHCTLDYTNRPTRRYVAGGLAPHVVGYVGRIPAERADEWAARGYPPDALIGIDGIERFWEDTLAGRGESTLNIVLNGVVRTLAKREAVPSQSVYLTLDRKLQESLQNILGDAYANSVWGKTSTGGAAIVMNIHTGEILAIASYPDFNVDAFNPHSTLKDAQALIQKWADDPRKPTLNRATLGQYPPGSVFKIVSMAAAADSGQFNLTTRYTCNGIWDGAPLGDRKREDWIYGTAQRQHGTITLKQALTGSCNIYFWHVGWTLNAADPNTLSNYARRMGFGAPTGIKDVAEAAGALPDPANYEKLWGRAWRGSDALNNIIGQGDVVVSPLQIVRMVAAVANDGTLYQPMLVKQVGIIGSPSYIAKPVANGQLDFKPGVLQGIREAMCAVTTDPTLGTAYFVFKDFSGVTLCGKTGTAQTGGLPHAWFAAFAGKTADEPEIAVVVIIERSHEGSFVAAPIVRRIVETYYDLPITPWPSWYNGLPALTIGD